MKLFFAPLLVMCLSGVAFPQGALSPANTESRLLWGHAGSFPDLPIGALVGWDNDYAVGFFLSIQSNLGNFSDKSQDYYSTISEFDARVVFNDPERWRRTGWNMFLGGLIRRFSPFLSGYLGVGYVQRTDYVKFYDNTRILGMHGDYWVKSGEDEYVNLCGGVMLFLERGPCIMVGGATSPPSIQLGFGFTLAMD